MTPPHGRPALLQLPETVLELMFSLVPFTERQADVTVRSVQVGWWLKLQKASWDKLDG